MYQNTSKILIILAEVGIVLILCYVLNWLVNKTFKQLRKISWLKVSPRNLKIWRQNIQKFLILSCLLLSLAVVGFNAWLIYQGKNLHEYTLSLIGSVSKGFWVKLGIASVKSILLVIFAFIAQRIVRLYIKKIRDRVQQWGQIQANEETVDVFFSTLTTTITNAIWVLWLMFCGKFFGVPEVLIEYLHISLDIYLIIVIGLLILKANIAIIDSLDALSEKYSSPDNLLRFYDDFRDVVSLLKRCLEYAIYAAIATLVVQQVDSIANLATYGVKTIQIIGIIFVSSTFIEVTKLVVQNILTKEKNLTELNLRRRKTFIPLVNNSLKYTIYFAAAIAILSVLEIDTSPILAAAGIFSLAIGFGAKNFINDMVCGLLILFENYYLVGDLIEINGAEAVVEAIELRTTQLRSSNGQKHIIRNGEIKSIINYSKEYVYAVVEVGVEYDTDLNHVYKVIEELGKDLQEHNDDVLEPTKVNGLESFAEFELLVSTKTKVRPGQHKAVQRILRKMIKEAFENEGIELPHAHHVEFQLTKSPKSNGLEGNSELN